MKSCCDYHADIECNGGRNCPARASKHWCATSRQPCTQPYTCATACQIVTANSDGSSPHDEYEWTLTAMGWVVLAGLAFWLTVITIYFFYF